MSTCSPRAALAIALLLGGVAAIPVFGDSPNTPFPGLEIVASNNVGALYRRPDMDISAYSKIIIGEPEVAFSKSWNPRNYGTFGLSPAQLKKIRDDLAEQAKSTFAQVLGDAGYVIVTEPGDGVIYITPNIVNVFITAPATQSPSRAKTYTMDAGSMMLVLQVSDAVTGTLLAVAVDQRRSGSTTMQWTTSMSNRAAASAMIKGWAEQLKRELDAAKAK